MVSSSIPRWMTLCVGSHSVPRMAWIVLFVLHQDSISSYVLLRKILKIQHIATTLGVCALLPRSFRSQGDGSSLTARTTSRMTRLSRFRFTWLTTLGAALVRALPKCIPYQGSIISPYIEFRDEAAGIIRFISYAVIKDIDGNRKDPAGNRRET